MKKYLIPITVVVLLLLMFILNPDTKQHKEKVLTELKPAVMKYLKGDSQIVNFLTATLLANYIEEMLVEQIHVDNYYIFSITKSKDKTIGIGILGNVFLFVSEEEALRKLQNKVEKGF